MNGIHFTIEFTLVGMKFSVYYPLYLHVNNIILGTKGVFCISDLWYIGKCKFSVNYDMGSSEQDSEKKERRFKNISLLIPGTVRCRQTHCHRDVKRYIGT